MSSSNLGGYDFSQLFHGSILAFSPGTTFLATAHLNRIIVRSSASLQIVRTWVCVKPTTPLNGSASRFTKTNDSPDNQSSWTVDQLLWSADSMYILAFSAQAKTAWIFGLAHDGDGEGGELARIGGEGTEGLVRVEWGKSGREILAWSDHSLKLSIYDLSNGEMAYIQYPKSHHNCYSYSPDAKYFAVAERHFGKEHIGIYDVLDRYRLIRHFPLSTTDVQGILWSPCGKYIAAWDNGLSYSLHIHSPIGPHLTHFTPSSPTFSSTSTSEDPGLGIRTVTWAPGGRWIALGGWDGKVRIVESEGWRCIAALQWGGRTAEKDVAVWREPSGWLKETRGRGIVQFDRIPLPASIPTVRPDLSKPNPRVGVSQLSFDRDATLLLVRLDHSPNLIHVHTFLPAPTSETPQITHLASMIFSSAVKSAKWCPAAEGGRGRKLAVATREGSVYFWDGEGGWVEEGESEGGGEEEVSRGGMMEGIGIPSRTEFASWDIHWSPDGLALAIQDKDQFCLLYEDPDPNTGHESMRQWDGIDEGLTHINEEDEEDVSLRWEMDMRESLSGPVGAIRA